MNKIKDLRESINKLQIPDDQKISIKESLVDAEYYINQHQSRSSIDRKWRPWASVAMVATFLPLAVADSFGFMGAEVNEWVYIMLGSLVGSNVISRGFEKVKGKA